MADDNGYEFTIDWFSHFEALWKGLFQQLVPGARKILEIGSFEGRSTVWLIEHGFPAQKAGEIHCIDTWEGGVEHRGVPMDAVQSRFDRNVEIARRRSPGVVVHKIKSVSLAALASLMAQGHRSSFDFIYIDGSHQAADVLGDLVMAFALCRVGGIIACDDYMWNFGQNPLLTPKLAIDSFVNCFSTKLLPVMGPPLQQLFLSKRTE